MAEVAEEALVSRATAYRYFSSVESLLVEASVDVEVPDPERDVLEAGADEARATKCWAIQALVRAALADSASAT